MASRYDKMMRLWAWIKKTDHRFYGYSDGFGQVHISDQDCIPIVESEFWIVDFLSGKLSARHIHQALVEGVTPYEVAARKKRARSTTIDRFTSLTRKRYKPLIDVMESFREVEVVTAIPLLDNLSDYSFVGVALAKQPMEDWVIYFDPCEDEFVAVEHDRQVVKQAESFAKLISMIKPEQEEADDE